jgi:hypothetical protein
MNLREYDIVRVSRLLVADRSFDGTDAVKRAPRLGDVGTIVYELDPANAAAPVVVEMVDDSGMTIWLADFERAELELVRRP